MNLATEDWVARLVDIQTQLVSNLEEAWRQYKKNVDEHHKD
jgi:hypothetical protein